jgi:threonylcarbamoyladenosine tRNA methylthiotransferase MtaB
LRENLLAGGAASAVQDFEAADLCVINTCTVTAQADNEALRLIRRISRRNPAARLVVTGCLASRDPAAILREAPGAVVVGNEGKDAIPAMLGCSAAPAGVRGLDGRSRAFVKIQDGCNMGCGFCVIPSIRPTLSCKPYGELEAEMRGLVEKDVPEIVLCGVRLGRYLSTDAGGRRVDFVAALERLLALPGDFRIRLSSLEITDVTDRLIGLMAASGGKLCPSLHVPLQSGSAGVLRRMKRWYSAEFYARRIAALKRRIPNVGLFADVMAGFPDETDGEHSESRDFIAGLGFSGLHVFRYSSRPGTPAARGGQVEPGLILDRAQELRELDGTLRSSFAAKAVGSVRRVVAEIAGPEALAEDFLTVRLDVRPGPGWRQVRVISSAGPVAHGVLS